MQDVFIRASLIYKAVQAVQAAVKESESLLFLSAIRAVGFATNDMETDCV